LAMKLFQSTLPIQGATFPLSPSRNVPEDFNPRSQYRERRLVLHFSVDKSIFQSTLPIQGATLHNPKTYLFGYYFNPRSQYRERHHMLYRNRQHHIFQSTLPIQGATGYYSLSSPVWAF